MGDVKIAQDPLEWTLTPLEWYGVWDPGGNERLGMPCSVPRAGSYLAAVARVSGRLLGPTHCRDVGNVPCARRFGLGGRRAVVCLAPASPKKMMGVGTWEAATSN